MKCPTCKDVNLVISERKSVEIDYCPECRGVWLDRGELDKILEKSQEIKAKEYSDSYSQKPHKRRKSFFEEIFD